MASILRNRIQGESSREDAEGIEATIQDLLSNVTRSQSGGICNAHTDAALYDIGDPHPCFANLFCSEKRVRPERGENSEFVVDYIFRAFDYELDSGGAFSMSGSLAAGKTSRDRDNNQVILTYTYPAPPLYKDPLLAGQTRNQVAELEIDKPTLLLRWSRYNTFSNAWNNTRAALGALNELIVWGFPAESVLCTRAEIEQAGQKWREIFEFQWGQDWRAYAIFKQEDDNRPVENPGATGEAFADVYPLYNFNLLGLLLPS